MPSDSQNDLDLIAGRVDEEGDELPGHEPIENPGPPDEVSSGDPLTEPHPDEPGVKSNGEAGPTENPGL